MGRKVAIIGATGTIGSAVANRFEKHYEVLRVSRHSTPQVDMSDVDSIRAFYKEAGPLDAIVVCAGFAPFSHLTNLSREDFSAAATGKLLGQVSLVTEGLSYLNNGGSFTLTTGILSQHPIAGSAAASMANGGVESFVTAASTELPRGQRINAVSPTVLKEATGFHSAFPGFKQVLATEVADAYIRSVEGVETGKVFQVWN